MDAAWIDDLSRELRVPWIGRQDPAIPARELERFDRMLAATPRVKPGAAVRPP